MQRRVRGEIFARLDVMSAEATAVQMETAWSFEPYVTAMASLMSEFAGIQELDFLRTLLSVRLRERKAYVFGWGRRDAPDFERFKRVYAAASGVLSR